MPKTSRFIDSFCLANDDVGDVESQKFLAVVSRLLATAYCKRATVPWHSTNGPILVRWVRGWSR